MNDNEIEALKAGDTVHFVRTDGGIDKYRVVSVAPDEDSFGYHVETDKNVNFAKFQLRHERFALRPEVHLEKLKFHEP